MLFFSYTCISLSAYNNKDVRGQPKKENRLGRDYFYTDSTNLFHVDMKQMVDTWRQQLPLSAIKYVYSGSIAKALFYKGLEYILNTTSSLLNLYSIIINKNKNYLIKNLMRKLFNSS